MIRDIDATLAEMEQRHASVGTVGEGTSVREFNEHIVRRLIAGEPLQPAEIRQVWRALQAWKPWEVAR